MNASDTGLGTTLIQEGHPIAYASGAPSDAETRNAQMEKELLAVVFGLEEFHLYMYRQQVKVQSDHKLVEIIATKALYRAPKRPQRMLVMMQTCNAEMHYWPAKDMQLADTLSRAYFKDPRVDKDIEFEMVNMADRQGASSIC